MATNASNQWMEQPILSKLDYSQDYSDLLQVGDGILSSVWHPVAGLNFSNEGVAGSLAVVWIDSAVPGTYRVVNTTTTTAGRSDTRSFLLYIVDVPVVTVVRSDLFARDEFLAKFRTDRMASVQRYLPANLLDDYLWSKLLAAEADARRKLHVFLVPTVQFPNDPTPAEIDALAGAPWAVDPGYDLDAHLTPPGGWSFLSLRQAPVVALESITFSYPGMGLVYTVPAQWIKVDKKQGHVRFIATSNAMTTPMGGFMASAMGMQSAPQFIEVRYTAGLTNAVRDYPDLLDLVQRMVLLGLLTDAVLPGSSSISADGLSQSMSAPDLEKMKTGIDAALEALRIRIQGIPLMVL